MPYTVQKTPFGYRSEIVSPFAPAEAQRWLSEIKQVVGTGKLTGQLIDSRLAKANSPESGKVIEEAMTFVRARGLQRSAVILSSSVVKMQIQRMARESGVDSFERYIDASADPEWEKTAIAWIEKGVDPEQLTAPQATSRSRLSGR